MNRALYANKLGFEALKNIDADQDYYDCDCGGMYEKKKICFRCGKKICASCEQYHGKRTEFCVIQEDIAYNPQPDIQDRGNGIGVQRFGKLVRLNDQGIPY